MIPQTRASLEKMDSSIAAPQSWADHKAMLRGTWRQGEHILIAAPTNAGKTTLMSEIVNIRRHVVVMVSKVHDDTFRDEFKGWRIVADWKDVRPQDEKVLLWPKGGRTLRETVMKQRAVFKRAFDAIGNGRGWCVVIDEMHYMASAQFCNLDAEIAILHHQGRSQKLTMVTLTQRPSWIPRIIYSSVTHAYIARTRDVEDLKKLSNFGGQDAKELGAAVVRLPSRHDYVYINPQGDLPARTVNVRQ